MLASRVVACGLNDFVREPPEVEEDAAGVAHGLRDFAGPDVLPDEERGGGVRLELLGCRLEVLFREEPAGLHAEVLEALADVLVELDELEGGHVAVLVLADEGDVHEADRPRVDQVGKRGRDLAPELVAWEGNDQILDGSDLRHLSLLALRLHCTQSVSHDA